MRTRTAIVAGLLALLAMTGTGAQGPERDEVDEALRALVPSIEAALTKAVTPAEPSRGTAELPKPSMTEPFGIGEALYDPGRLADAVVSLLALMRVVIVPDTAATAAAAATNLVLSQSEVRALIDMGREDLEASDDIENLPHSVADLHAAVADLLPALSIEQLARAYTKAYETRADDLIAKALMGRPIEPDTKLTRTQIWFLMMDGFAGAAAGGASWGTADRELPDLPSPNPQWSAPEWREVFSRLPLVSASRLVTLNAPAAITQGTTANPAPVNVTLRVNPSAPPLVSKLTGRTLIAARAGSLSGQEVTWRVEEDSVFEEVGTIASPVDEPIRVGADGLARFVVQPAVAPAGGAGDVVSDWGTILARFELRGLVASAYVVPAPLARLSLGTSTARANVLARWRSPDVLWMTLVNFYRGINFDIPGLGGGTRDGSDAWTGYLSKRKSGAYAGSGLAMVSVDLVRLRGPLGTPCGPAAGQTGTAVTFEQRMNVTATTPDGQTLAGFGPTAKPFGPTKLISDFYWFDTQRRQVSMVGLAPDGGYYSLQFFATSDPDPPGQSVCLPFIPVEGDRRTRSRSAFFAPFNDAQWTTPNQGYGIGLKAKGVTSYYDKSSTDPLTGTPYEAAKSAFKLTGRSHWAVVAARTKEELAAFMKNLKPQPKP